MDRVCWMPLSLARRIAGLVGVLILTGCSIPNYLAADPYLSIRYFGGQDHPNPELYIFQSVGQSERDLILDEDRSAWNHRNLAVSPAQYAVVVAKLQQYAGDHPRVSCDVAGSHSRLVGGLSVRELNHDDSLGSVCMWAVGKPMFPLLKYIEEIAPETEDTNEWRQSTHHFFYVDERPWPLEPPFVP
jgi:hypothetical protein